MRTNTRVEFGLYDVTARGDSVPSSTDARSFCDLSSDLLLDKVPALPLYGTLETRQFLMDGSYSLFPDSPSGQFWGLWSSQLSDESGRFSSPPVLQIRFSKTHSSSGLMLHFYAPTEDWASELTIQWYGSDGGLLTTAVFTPDAVDYYCARKVENYRSIVLTFTATNRPGRYLKLSGLDYGKFLTFEGSEVVEAHILEEINPLSDELSINTLNLTLFNRKGDFSILNPDGVFDVLQHKQKFTVWEDVRENTRSTEIVSHNMGTFYLSDWENTSDTLASFTAVDAIGLLDSAPFNGGVYNTTVGNLVAEVLDGYEYELDAALAAESISGYLPMDTRRTALQQIAFAVGAVVDCSRSDKIKIFPAPERSSGLITYQRKFSDGNKVTLKPLITGVSVTAHRYTAGAETEELYKDELVAGTHQITFSSPALADSLTATGGTLVERGTNYCNVTVTTPGEVVVTGQKYIETTTVLQQTASNLPPNAQDNVLTVTDATLVSPDRAEALAQRILTYYAQRYEQTFRMLAGTEVLADMLIVESFGGEMVRGQLEKMEFDLTGGYRADVRVTGRRLSLGADAYTGEIYAGERSLI
mgnify:FL=1